MTEMAYAMAPLCGIVYYLNLVNEIVPSVESLVLMLHSIEPMGIKVSSMGPIFGILYFI